MFSYYGSKSKIVNSYPKPKFDTIIESFAGSARYSLKWFDRNIILIDKYEIIINIWKYLQQASPKDILGLPEPNKGDDLRNLNISKEESNLIYYCSTGGEGGATGNKITAMSVAERNLISFGMARGTAKPQNKPGNFNSWHNDKKRIAKSLYKIKHWKLILGDYTDSPNIKATFFIDPPYQFGGYHYKHSNKNINYKHLSEWCKSRDGQVIVCENTKADWMDFKPIKSMRGIKFTTTEAIWSNEKTIYDNTQTILF